VFSLDIGSSTLDIQVDPKAIIPPVAVMGKVGRMSSPNLPVSHHALACGTPVLLHTNVFPGAWCVDEMGAVLDNPDMVDA